MVNLPEMQRCLQKYGVSADRKCLYDDIKTLRIFGINVEGKRIGRDFKYHVRKKQIDFDDLKLLINVIQSSKDISEETADKLIKKLMGFASSYEAADLESRSIVRGHIASRDLDEDTASVEMEFQNEMVDQLLDRFGGDIPISPAEKDSWSLTRVDVPVNRAFFGWLFSLGDSVKIVGPDEVVEKFLNEINVMRRFYDGMD